MSLIELPFIIPFGRNRGFIGREAELDQLLHLVPPACEKDDCQRTVVEGLGGIGKTQLSLEAAYLVRERYPECSVFWVSAVSSTTFENAYRAIGETLQLQDAGGGGANIPKVVKNRLEKTQKPWLLIVDNVDDLKLLNGDDGLESYLPFNRKGSILFTTRNHEVTVQLGVSKKNTIKMIEMTEDEAIEMLQNDLDSEQLNDKQSISELIQCLAHIPLAIKQASAYMLEAGISPAKYLEYYHSSSNTQINLLGQSFPDLQRYRGTTSPIATTWHISFQQISQQNHLAIHYLKFASVLSEKDIPISILPVDDEIQRDRALRVLQAYAFISKRIDADSFDMHRLVRLTTQNWIKQSQELEGPTLRPLEMKQKLGRDDWTACCTVVIQHLATICPFATHQNQHIWMRFMPHLRTALENEKDCADEEALMLTWKALAWNYYLVEKPAAAEQLRRQIDKYFQKTLGPYDQQTLENLDHLAVCVHKQGRYAEAEKMHRNIIQLRQKVFDPEHPSTLESMNNLANALTKQEKYSEATSLFRKTLELKEKVLGPASPATLATMLNLGVVLHSQGDYVSAVPLLQETIELKSSVIGPEHPTTVDSMTNLAIALCGQEKYEDSLSLSLKVIELNTKINGPEAAATIMAMGNMAVTFEKMGNKTDALSLYRKSFALAKKVTGEEAPAALLSMDNLAKMLGVLGEYEEAESLGRKLLEICTRVLGPEHLSTWDSLTLLSRLLEQQGKDAEAEQLCRQVIDMKTKALGRDHSRTLDNLYDLAFLRQKQSRYAEAETIYEEIISISERDLEKDDPNTARCKSLLQGCINERLGKDVENLELDTK